MSDVRVSIHQPTYMAWMGYFHKISCADIHVLYDDVDFSYGGWINRVKIRDATQALWMTVPIEKGQSLPLNQSKIAYNHRWADKQLRTLQYNYSKSPFYEDTIAFVKEILDKEYSSIAELNIEITQRICEKLGITTKFIRSSTLGVTNEDRTGKLIEIMQKVGGTIYIYGGGCDYMDTQQFDSAQIGLEAQNFSHPDYVQIQGEFISGLSILDVFFNVGFEGAQKLLKEVSS